MYNMNTARKPGYDRTVFPIGGSNASVDPMKRSPLQRQTTFIPYMQSA